MAVPVLGKAGVPVSGVAAVLVNVTVTGSTAGGYLSAFGDGSVRPTVSTLDFVKGQTVANSAVVPVGADGKIRLFNGSGGTSQLVVDIAGYYRSGTATAAGVFGSVGPVRILDTRSGLGARRAAVAAGGSMA